MGRPKKELEFKRKTKLHSLKMMFKIFSEIATSEDRAKAIVERHGLNYKYFLDKLSKNPKVCERYDLAKGIQMDTIIDKLRVDINEVEPERDLINKLRLKLDYVKWIAPKILPNKYGEKGLVNLNLNNPTLILNKLKDSFGYAEVTDDNDNVNVIQNNSIENIELNLTKKEECLVG
jgi:hypothetical protein